MNKYMAKFVLKRLTYQQAKAGPQRLARMLQLFRDPEIRTRARHDRVRIRTAIEPNKPQRDMGDC